MFYTKMVDDARDQDLISHGVDLVVLGPNLVTWIKSNAGMEK